MIVHFFQYKLYTKAFVEFTRKKYPLNQHLFIIYGKCPNANFKVEADIGVIFVEVLEDILKNKIIYQRIEQAQKIIVHSNNLLVTKLYLRKPSWLKKSYIVFWGFDLYCYRKAAKGIKNKIWRTVQLWQIKNAKAVCVLAEKEKQVLDTLVPGIQGKKMLAKYFNSSDNERQYSLINYKKSTDPIKIIVGNSASETNCHEKILNQLSRYADQNIQVYCPLSYGSEEYRIHITEIGKELFGDKFIPLIELMPYEEYYRLLNDCAIGLFNNDRQQAMGNILIMFEQGSKVFIRSDTPMWDLFKKQGYIFYNISDVGDLSWEKMIDFDEDKKKTNTQICIKRNSLDEIKKVWDVIYEDGLNGR